jgi:SHS2 domain-containing protein
MADYYYEVLDHTADLGIRVVGETLSDLYINAGRALFDLIATFEYRTKEDYISISVSGEDEADLLVNWLRELLYLFNGKELLVNSIVILALENVTLTARVGVIPHDPNELEIGHDIKAVTYHQVHVERLSQGFVARVIFDL